MSNEYQHITLDRMGEVCMNNFTGLKDSCVMSMSFQQNQNGVLWLLLSSKDDYKIVRLNTYSIGGVMLDYSIKGIRKKPGYHPHVLACNNNTLFVLHRSNMAWYGQQNAIKSYPVKMVSYDIHRATPSFKNSLNELEPESFDGDFYNNRPTGAYVHNGRILFVTDNQYNKVFAYNIEDVSRTSYGKVLEKECLMLHPVHRAPRSLWFEDDIMYVHDTKLQYAYAYNPNLLDTKDDKLWFNGLLESHLLRNFGKTPIEDFAMGKLGGDVKDATVVARQHNRYYVASADGIIHVFQINICDFNYNAYINKNY